MTWKIPKTLKGIRVPRNIHIPPLTSKQKKADAAAAEAKAAGKSDSPKQTKGTTGEGNKTHTNPNSFSRPFTGQTPAPGRPTKASSQALPEFLIAGKERGPTPSTEELHAGIPESLKEVLRRKVAERENLPEPPRINRKGTDPSPSEAAKKEPPKTFADTHLEQDQKAQPPKPAKPKQGPPDLPPPSRITDDSGLT